MLDWGNKNLAPEGVSVQLADRCSGSVVESVLMDRNNLSPITPENVLLQPELAASASMRKRAAYTRSRSVPVQDEEDDK